ncbi:Protein ABHD14A [Chionoecetes opilio]|uniref:Protein ABHD14A n=1 Tax=Chionoecetes opilio TaxID=41210 RepID=A0A8J4Y1N1_CHIOP|nr:Protein ABHD14A [Chionoecetes opilio]
MVPTLIIYGEKDTGLGHSSRDDLSNIPTSQAVELPGARHPAYLDQPKMFHTLLYNFIRQVHAHRAVV